VPSRTANAILTTGGGSTPRAPPHPCGCGTGLPVFRRAHPGGAGRGASDGADRRGEAASDHRPTLGRLLTLAPEGSQTRLFVYVPAGLERNIHVGQRYRMQVRVGDEGLIEVMALEKY